MNKFHDQKIRCRLFKRNQSQGLQLCGIIFRQVVRWHKCHKIMQSLPIAITPLYEWKRPCEDGVPVTAYLQTSQY